MTKKLNLAGLALLVFISAFGQVRLGEVACVYVTTPDLDSSAAVYEQLGFSRTGSNTFPVPWTQLSDGSLMIMMRKDKTPYTGLAYYSTHVADIAADLEKQGIQFSQKPKPGDPIQRYYFTSPDGFSIMLADNIGGFTQPTGATLLNMKQEDYSRSEKYPNAVCGAFGEFCHPVLDLDKSVAFWQKLGFSVKSKMAQPYPHAILYDGMMIVGLHQTRDFNYPAITYFGIDSGRRFEQLRNKGLRGLAPFMGPANLVLKTWEGQHVFLFSLF